MLSVKIDAQIVSNSKFDGKVVYYLTNKQWSVLFFGKTVAYLANSVIILRVLRLFRERFAH